MATKKNAVQVSQQPENAIQEAHTIEDTTKRIFKETIDPNQTTSIINGNKLLFLGRGAREITITTDTQPADN